MMIHVPFMVCARRMTCHPLTRGAWALTALLACTTERGASAPPLERSRVEAPTSAEEGASPTASTTAERPTPAAAPTARTRELPSAATFGDLVASAAEVEASERASDARCGLRGRADGRYRLEANLAPSIMKAAPRLDLDEVAPFIGQVSLATPSGLVGHGPLIVALSPLPQRIRLGIVSVFSVTDKAVYFSAATHQGLGEGPATVIDEKNLHVVRGMMPNADAVLVTAERDVPLDRVRDVLKWTEDAKGPVVLGVFLGEGDDIPPEWASARAPDG